MNQPVTPARAPYTYIVAATTIPSVCQLCDQLLIVDIKNFTPFVMLRVEVVICRPLLLATLWAPTFTSLPILFEVRVRCYRYSQAFLLKFHAELLRAGLRDDGNRGKVVGVSR